jgi:hypothetical protein
MQGNGVVFGGGNASLLADSSIARSATSSGFVRYTYPIGFPGGIAPAKHFVNISGPKEVYAGFWWRPSAGFEGHPSNVNKLLFLLGTGGSGNTVLDMWGTGSPYRLMITIQHPTCNSHITNSVGDSCGTRNIFGNVSSGEVSLGKWHLVEVYQKLSSTMTSRDGVLRWWLDGQLVGNYTSVNLAGPQVEFQFDPTWGGMGSTKIKEDYFDFDDLHISFPTSGSSTDQPPGPPAAPRILNVTVQ